MPAPKSWSARIPQIRKEVEASEASNFSRPEVERLFGVGRTQADSVMTAAGSRMVVTGKVRVKFVARRALLDYLTYSTAAADADRERERLCRVAKSLAGENDDAELKAVRLPFAPCLKLPKLEKDFPGITFVAPVGEEPGEMRIRFWGPADLLQQFYELGQALLNKEQCADFYRLTDPQPAKRKMEAGDEAPVPQTGGGDPAAVKARAVGARDAAGSCEAIRRDSGADQRAERKVG